MNWESLTSRRIAGIPVLYLAAALAAVALFYAIRMRSSVAADSTATDAAATDSTGDSGGDLVEPTQPVFYAQPTSTVSIDDSSTADNAAGNEDWGRVAVDWLINNGFTYEVASQAITKYLDGQQLSMQEGAARDAAIKHFGQPPDGLLTTSTSGYKGPASAQGTPPTVHKVRGKSDNSPEELAVLYYGMNTADAVRTIRAANTTVTVPYPVGTSIQIPKYHNPHYFKATQSVRGLTQIAAKNGITAGQVIALNPGKKFPVAVGTRVRIS